MSFEQPEKENKDYAIMSLSELEADPAAAALLEENAFRYLQTIDKEWFEKNYYKDLNAYGRLVALDGTDFTTPMQNIGGGKSLQWVIDETKMDLMKDASPEELKRIKMPELFITFEKLYAEIKGNALEEYLGQLQELAREAQDPQLKEYLAKTAHNLVESGNSRNYESVAQSIIDAFLERGKDFGLRV